MPWWPRWPRPPIAKRRRRNFTEPLDILEFSPGSSSEASVRFKLRLIFLLKTSTYRNNIAINLRFRRSQLFVLYVKKARRQRRPAGWASQMAPSSAADRNLASAVDPVRATDLPHRRRGVQAPVAEARRQRPNLDSLAIGAPLTAAFVGALLIGPGLAGDAAHGAPDGVSAARGAQAGDAEAAAGAAGDLPPGSAHDGAAAAALAHRQGAPIDPVSVDGQPPARHWRTTRAPAAVSTARWLPRLRPRPASSPRSPAGSA
jgi:hypothetical protein